MSINSAYAGTIPAVFKIVEIILSIICLVLVAVTDIYRLPGAGGWMFFVAIITIIVSSFFYIIHLTNVIYKFSGPMTFVEFICLAISSVFHFVAMVVTAATTQSKPTAIAAAVFFAVAFIMYGLDTFFLFALYRVHGAYLNNEANSVPPVSPKSKQQQNTYTNSAFNYQ